MNEDTGSQHVRRVDGRRAGHGTWQPFGQAYEPLLLGASVLLIEWLILGWMYRRHVFLRV